MSAGICKKWRFSMMMCTRLHVEVVSLLFSSCKGQPQPYDVEAGTTGAEYTVAD